MAHFAKIDSQTNTVLEVNVINNSDIQDLSFPESEQIGIEFLIPWNTPNTYWKQTSYNGNFRKFYAGIGYTYYADIDSFVSPKPYASWRLNNDTAQWEAPMSMPNDGKIYSWDEDTKSWLIMNQDNDGMVSN